MTLTFDVVMYILAFVCFAIKAFQHWVLPQVPIEFMVLGFAFITLALIF